jgi:glyoxylase-like metal-dependent hydrolase (beta-lactamase superfamily II)
MGLADSQPYTTLAVQDKKEIKLEGITVTAYPTPCHTKGHLIYEFDTHLNEFDSQ